MSKYEVTTLQGRFTVDAESEDQARLLGKDGGRVVIGVVELTENDEGEFVADVDPDGHSFDATRPDAAIIESPSSDFGDEEIVIVRRSDWDRAVGLARLNDESYQPAEAVPVDNHDLQGPVPAYRDPTAAVEVSEATDDPGLPAPRDDRAAEAFANAGGEPFDPSRRESVHDPAHPSHGSGVPGDRYPLDPAYDPTSRLDAAREAVADEPRDDGPTDFVVADDVPGDASDATEVTPQELEHPGYGDVAGRGEADDDAGYRVTDGDPPPADFYGGRRNPHDRT